VSAAASDRFWLKTWTVAGVVGDQTEMAWANTMVGSSISLAEHKIVDPMTGDCQQAVSYDDVQIRPVKDLGRHFGDFWQWPPGLSGEVAYGWIRCAGTNVGAFAFVDARHAYRFYENGIVFRLQ
jgi:hypothetical protein